MPFTVRKHGSHYDIVKKLPSGGTKVQGHSTTKAKAQASARAANAGSKHK